MSIETACPGCQRTLRVPSEHAGKQARCPLCNTIYTVGNVEAAKPETGLDGDSPDWRMRTSEGQTYGPVSKSELDRWVSEGRVTGDCELHCVSDNQWQTAEVVYTSLAQRPQTSKNASADPSQPRSAARYRYTEPHRGTLILVLGILSWVVSCPVFGIVAWVLGSNDLREMRTGRMNPNGMGLTQAGLILGRIHTMILIAIVVLGLLLALVGAILS